MKPSRRSGYETSLTLVRRTLGDKEAREWFMISCLFGGAAAVASPLAALIAAELGFDALRAIHLHLVLYGLAHFLLLAPFVWLGARARMTALILIALMGLFNIDSRSEFVYEEPYRYLYLKGVEFPPLPGDYI